MPFFSRPILTTALLLASAAAAQAQTTSGSSVLRACTSAETRATQRFWPLNNKVMLDFAVSGASYTVANNPATTAAETNSAVTNASGQLQFFVDGGNIFRADGTVMPNGTGLKARPSAEQSSVAFANPAKKGEYYVFTNNTVTAGFTDASSDKTWYYSVVDMTANGGLGAVTVKNVQVAATTGKSSEAMTAVPNAAGDGFWVVGVESNTDKIMAFEVKSSGVGTVVESSMGYTDAGTYTSLNFNSDGSKLVAQNRKYPSGTGNISVMDFDRVSGTVTNTIVWPISGLSDYYSLYSATFSPDSQSLYVSTMASNGTSYLYSYDLSNSDAATIAGTQRRITRTGGYGGALRIGADGALWWANGVVGTKASDYLYRLPTPNTRPAAGSTMSVFEQIGVNGGGDYSGAGLTQTLPSCFADPVLVPPEITIAKTSSTPGPVAAGGQVGYTVTVANVGTVVASQLHLTDAFPPGLISASWTCTASGGTPTQACAAPSGSATVPAALLDQTFDLQPGASVVYQMNTQAGSNAVTSTENTATATVPGGAACSKGGTQQASCSATTPKGQPSNNPTTPTPVPANAPWALLALGAAAAWRARRVLR